MAGILSITANYGAMFTQLPDEMIKSIMDWMPDKDRISLGLTCRRMLDLLQPMRKNILLRFPNKSIEEYIEKIYDRESFEKYKEKIRDKILIKDMIRWSVSANLVSGLAYYAKNHEVRKRYNRRLEVETDKFVKDMLPDENYGIFISLKAVEKHDIEMRSFVQNILQRCQNITKIQIHHDIITPDFYHHLKFRGVNLLGLDDDDFLCEDGLHSIAISFPRIRRLVVLSYYWSIFTCGHVKNLLYVSNLDRLIVNTNTNLPNSWTLDVYIGHYVSVENFDMFLKSCKPISILTVYNLKDAGFAAISDHLCQSLLELTIKGKCRVSNGKGFKKMIRNCTKLQSFTTKESRISKASLIGILRLPMMTKIGFVKCEWLNELDVEAVGRYFDKIEDLDLSDNLDVDDRVLQKIMHHCTRLEKLKLMRNRSTDEHIFLEAGARLQYLDITHYSFAEPFARALTEDEVIRDIILIPEQYPTLNHLRISQYFESYFKYIMAPSTIRLLRSKIDTVEVVSDDWIDENTKPHCTLCSSRSRQLALYGIDDPLELNPSGFDDDNDSIQDYSDPNTPGPNTCFIS